MTSIIQIQFSFSVSPLCPYHIVSVALSAVVLSALCRIHTRNLRQQMSLVVKTRRGLCGSLLCCCQPNAQYPTPASPLVYVCVCVCLVGAGGSSPWSTLSSSSHAHCGHFPVSAITRWLFECVCVCVGGMLGSRLKKTHCLGVNVCEE